MKPIQFFLISFIILSQSCVQNPDKKSSPETGLTSYINPFTGTSNAGNQVPGPLCPFGMIHPGPVNNGQHVPLATNYIFGNPEMFGFAMTNMAGVGCANYGSIMLMPTMGRVDFTDYRSTYSAENAYPGYYSVQLDEDGIKVEMTSTERAAILKFHFPAGQANLLIDLSRRSSEDTAFMIRKVSAGEFEGYKNDGQFCSAGKDIHHKVYFVIKVNGKGAETGIRNGYSELSLTSGEAKGEDIGAYLSWNFRKPGNIEARVGISYVSIENARLNLDTETKGKDFNAVVTEAGQKWEKMLSHIAVEGGTEKQKEMFYTALYHTMSHPNILNDVNGEYPAMGSHKTMKIKDNNTRYTVFSLWDTYRTLHPFLTLVYPGIQEQMCRSIMDMYHENGWLPQWELVSREAHVMVGDPASIVLNDSYVKGIHFDDPDTILKAMVHNAEHFYITPQWNYPDVHHIRRGIVPYLEHNGWIPYDYKEKHPWLWATVATTQEYNLADWNISRFARMLKNDAVASRFEERSRGYRNLYDSNTMFFRQRYANGKWVEPFDPFARYNEMPWRFSGGPGYCEGMAWHYDFFVPHDIPGVIKLMGGEEAFINRLQTLFDSAYYDPSNEPDIASPFLFNYVKGQEWRTQKTVRNLVDTAFSTEPGGIPGNDDTGTMSSWLMFAMMGIYPDCPGNPQYQLSTPVFDKITIRLDSSYYKGKTFVIKCDGSPGTQKYIGSITFNGHPHKDYTLKHSDIVNGGELVFHLKDNK